MAGLTLAQMEARLALYVTAEEKILEGQSYSIGGRALTRADLGAVQKKISELNRECQELGGSRKISLRGATPA